MERTLNTYVVMPEGCRWTMRQAYTAEMAYKGECCWYKPTTQIAVLNIATGETHVYIRETDGHGNLARVVDITKEVKV